MKENICLGRRNNNDQVLKIFNQLEKELMICSQRIDHSIDDTMTCLNQIDDIKSKINRLKEIIYE